MRHRVKARPGARPNPPTCKSTSAQGHLRTHLQQLRALHLFTPAALPADGTRGRDARCTGVSEAAHSHTPAPRAAWAGPTMAASGRLRFSQAAWGFPAPDKAPVPVVSVPPEVLRRAKQQGA